MRWLFTAASASSSFEARDIAGHRQMSSNLKDPTTKHLWNIKEH
jgi:hypothetical protein